MSSMANQAIEMGIDPVQAPGGGTWDDPHNRDYACSVARNRGFTPEYLDDDINKGRNCSRHNDYEERTTGWFATAQEAQDYAKRNVGTVITRSPDGNGYIIKK